MIAGTPPDCIRTHRLKNKACLGSFLYHIYHLAPVINRHQPVPGVERQLEVAQPVVLPVGRNGNPRHVAGGVLAPFESRQAVDFVVTGD
jgi:hypothetical protein